MSSKRFIKYDLAMSFAEQDKGVALSMYKCLKMEGLDVYFYKKENQWGDELNGILKKVYYSGSNNAVVILSKHYARNYWTNKEWRLLLKAKKNNRIGSIFIIRLDQSRLTGLTGNEVYEEWKGNPKDLSRKIRSQIKGRTSINALVLMLFLGIVTLCLIFWYFKQY